MNDTEPDIAEQVRVRLMALSGVERMRLGSNSFQAARRMVEASMPEGLSELERKRFLYRRIYGEDLPTDFTG